jgi:hypothetical protein
MPHTPARRSRAARKILGRKYSINRSYLAWPVERSSDEELFRVMEKFVEKNSIFAQKLKFIPFPSARDLEVILLFRRNPNKKQLQFIRGLQRDEFQRLLQNRNELVGFLLDLDL